MRDNSNNVIVCMERLNWTKLKKHKGDCMHESFSYIKTSNL